MQMTISWNNWFKKGSPSFKSLTNERSKLHFSNTSAVHYQRLSKSVLGTSLLLLWHSSFLKFLISFIIDSHSLWHMTSVILVNNAMSKSLWFVIQLDGQKIWRWFFNQHILNCSGSNLLYNCTPSVERFSFMKSTSRHNSPPP